MVLWYHARILTFNAIYCQSLPFTATFSAQWAFICCSALHCANVAPGTPLWASDGQAPVGCILGQTWVQAVVWHHVLHGLWKGFVRCWIVDLYARDRPDCIPAAAISRSCSGVRWEFGMRFFSFGMPPPSFCAYKKPHQLVR